MVLKNQRSNRWTGRKKSNFKTAEVAWRLIVCPLWNAILAGIWRTRIKVRYHFGMTGKEQEQSKRKNSSIYNFLCSLAIPQGYSLPEGHRISNCNTTVALVEKSCFPWMSESTLEHSNTSLSKQHWLHEILRGFLSTFDGICSTEKSCQALAMVWKWALFFQSSVLGISSTHLKKSQCKLFIDSWGLTRIVNQLHQM